MDRERADQVRDALERFEGPLLLYAQRLLGDAHGARDAVQETFLRLADRAPGSDEPRLPAWLYVVCRNLVRDRQRRERVMERTDTPALDARPDTAGSLGIDPALAAERSEESARVLRMLEALPEKQREVLRLRFGHGLRYREVAEVTGLTVTHVGVLVHHGLRNLRARCGAAALDGGAR